MDHDLDLHAEGPALTAALVDVSSVSGEEGPLADAIERALRRLPHLRVTRHGNTLVARTGLGNSGRGKEERVVLAGHIDTVPHAGNFPSQWGPQRLRLTGVGTSDMKAGVAVQLRLAATLPEPNRDVTYVFYECEEVDVARNGLFLLSRDAPELLIADFAVLLEPSGGVVEGGCQGTLRAAITARGARAHTARSWMGKNAIHEAGAILDILRAWEPRRPVVDGLEYHEGLNAVEISGGDNFGGFNGFSSPVNSGALICLVYPDSPAASGGIAGGDVITSVNGTAVTSADGLTALTANSHPGDKFAIDYVDQFGTKHSTTITLTEWAK